MCLSRLVLPSYKLDIHDGHLHVIFLLNEIVFYKMKKQNVIKEKCFLLLP
jgi:hypothetical protein